LRNIYKQEKTVQDVLYDLRSEPLTILGHLGPGDVAIVVVVEPFEELLHLLDVGEVLAVATQNIFMILNLVLCLIWTKLGPLKTNIFFVKTKFTVT
jgi:hypothetical protein